MSYQWALSITFRSLTAIAIFGVAAYFGYLAKRAGARRGWNGRLWRYLTRPHHIRPQTDADRHDWQAVLWPFGVFLVLAVVIWLTDPTR